MMIYLMETWRELSEQFLQHPEKLVINQLNYWKAHMTLCEELLSESSPPSHEPSKDKRFQHPDWQKNVIFNFIQRSYELFSQHAKNLVEELNDKDEKTAQKLRFYMRQLLDFLSPTNFINTNPDVLSKALETNGESLLDGFKQFQEDLIRNQGHFKIPLTDTEQFEVGKNIACTPGHVIYQNDMMQLIQYRSTTKKIHQYPLLIIPPWINKYYILDLKQDNSLVYWLVNQGITVFMISWVNPSSEHQYKTFFDYLNEGPLTALEVISKVTKQKNINLLGYCVGGTLLGCLLAYRAKNKSDINIKSATFLTTLLDFSEPGDLGTFIDEKQVTMLEEEMQKKGYLDGETMASVFNALRANDLIWSAFVNQYLKGEKPKPFDILYWNSDSTNIPAPAHSFYLRNMYLNNFLVEPNKIKMNGIALDLKKIQTPCYFLAAHDDHIVPWRAAYRGSQFLTCPTKFVLSGSGHVAGVINPPNKKKYGYWTNEEKMTNADVFFEKATQHEGSWWNDWHTWLKEYAGPLITTQQITIKNKIESAPGSYAKTKLADIKKSSHMS